MAGPFEKLRAAIHKATHRANARDQEAETAKGRARHLSAEIRELLAEVDKLSKRYASTLKTIGKEEARKLDRAKIKRLVAKAEKEAVAIQDLAGRIHRKRDRRAGFGKTVRRQKKRARWWIARQTVLRKKLAAAKKEWEETHGTPAFEPWMLNGCPNVDNDNLKEVIAFVVAVCGQYVTATSNGTHATDSFHYSDRAADWGAGSVSSMQDAAVKTREHFGRGHFLEFFSPCPWWIKYGAEYPGYFPGHGDHGHTAVEG